MWLQNTPIEPGDYLWVYMWGCNCCVAKCGIVTLCNGEFNNMSGDKLDLECVDGWLRLESLPES